ncbi:MAG: hypothetical protein LC722_02915, partial [Actinobacteria bacterium]|nr:hypothetical protein [Actinomycetota bacterium]
MAGSVSAPLRLLRFPATLAAVVVASLLLTLAGAASPLFVTSAGNAALDRQIAGESARIPAFEVRRPSQVVPDIVAYRDAALRRATDLPGLGEPVVAAIGSLAEVQAGGPPRSADVRVVTRTGAFDHLHVVEGASGAGVWIADRAARLLDVHPGDLVTVSRLGDPGVRVRVDTVYRDLALGPPDPYWTPFGAIIYPANDDDPAPPSFLVVDGAAFLAMQPRLDDRVELVWDLPLVGRPTLDQARALSARLERLGGMLSDETTEIGSTLASAHYQTPLPTWVEEADRTVAALVTPIETISLAGRGVALAVVIAAGIYVVRRRRVEFAVLHAR